MNPKAPKFNQAIAAYYDKLILDERGGQFRNCRFSGEKFYVYPEDIAFYKMIGAPLPTLSPKERMRRKLAFNNSYNLYKVNSAHSGKSIISQYPPGTPFKIYEHLVWYGDALDALSHGIAWNSKENFFDQFSRLQRHVPRPNLFVDQTNIDSPYTNASTSLKNCYLVFESMELENCLYCIMGMSSRELVDCFTVFHSEQSYDCFESDHLYQCRSVAYSKNCIESTLLYDCRNCEHCFGCVNLRNRKYCFFNEQLMKEQYETKLLSFNLGHRETFQKLKSEFELIKRKAIYKENHNEQSVNSTGDYLKHCKNCLDSFYMIAAENIRYSIGGMKVKDSYDVVGGSGTSLSYESWAGVQNYGIRYSVNVDDECRDLEYCDLCITCQNCFGCIGLRNKKYCIFNTQYDEENYWRIVDEIKMTMLASGEYGEFFPPQLMPIPYNISLATSYAGYDDVETAKQYGYAIQHIEERETMVSGKMMSADDLPQDINDVKDDMLDVIIDDHKNNKKFQITKSELDFYRRYHIPLPQEHPLVRLGNMRKKFGPIMNIFYERRCAKCGKSMQTSYAPECPETVYCEQCYQREIV